MSEMLFPEYLNRGSKGPAVFILQMWLIGTGYGYADLVPDGDYGKQTWMAITNLQRSLEVEADGHFGPATREALRLQRGVDFNKIPASVIVGETEAVGP